MLDFSSSDLFAWRDACTAYSSAIESLAKPKLAALDTFYCDELPRRLRQRQRGGEGGDPNPENLEAGDLKAEDVEAAETVSNGGDTTGGSKRGNAKGGSIESRATRSRSRKREDSKSEDKEKGDGGGGGAYVSKEELVSVMEWKLTRGKWRPRLLDFVKHLDPNVVQAASSRAFAALAPYHTLTTPGGSGSGSGAHSEADVEASLKAAVTELSTLKGVGAATASAVLAAFAPEIAPFMSDEAMVAALGDCKDYSLRRYLVFAKAMREKASGLNRLEDKTAQVGATDSATVGAEGQAEQDCALWSSSSRVAQPLLPEASRSAVASADALSHSPVKCYQTNPSSRLGTVRQQSLTRSRTLLRSALTPGFHGISGFRANPLPRPGVFRAFTVKATYYDEDDEDLFELTFLQRLQRAWRIIFPPRNRPPSNAEIAKERLRLVLYTDRGEVSPEVRRRLRRKIIDAISAYVEIESEEDVQLSVSADPDIGTVYSITIPVRRVKPEYQEYWSESGFRDRFYEEILRERGPNSALTKLEIKREPVSDDDSRAGSADS
ncbi:unnamed protein product [Closterium sp. NIES-54]